VGQALIHVASGVVHVMATGEPFTKDDEQHGKYSRMNIETFPSWRYAVWTGTEWREANDEETTLYLKEGAQE